MKKNIIVSAIIFIIALIVFSFYFRRNFIIIRVNGRFKIAGISYFEKRRLLNRESEIIYLKGVVKGVDKDRDIEFFEAGIKGLKLISQGKVLGVMGPLYDLPYKFETSVKIVR